MLLDHDGYVTEGPGFNIFAVRENTVTTPDRVALEGVTRMTVIEICKELGYPVNVARLSADDLHAADELFAATTAGGVMPVSRIDGTVLGNDRPGPISRKLKETYWAWHEREELLTPVRQAGAA